MLLHQFQPAVMVLILLRHVNIHIHTHTINCRTRSFSVFLSSCLSQSLGLSILSVPEHSTWNYSLQPRQESIIDYCNSAATHLLLKQTYRMNKCLGNTERSRCLLPAPRTFNRFYESLVIDLHPTDQTWNNPLVLRCGSKHGTVTMCTKTSISYMLPIEAPLAPHPWAWELKSASCVGVKHDCAHWKPKTFKMWGGFNPPKLYPMWLHLQSLQQTLYCVLQLLWHLLELQTETKRPGHRQPSRYEAGGKWGQTNRSVCVCLSLRVTERSVDDGFTGCDRRPDAQSAGRALRNKQRWPEEGGRRWPDRWEVSEPDTCAGEAVLRVSLNMSDVHVK